MRFGSFVVQAIAVTFGAFAQVSILAKAAGVHLSEWPHVGAMVVLTMPFLSVDESDAPLAPLPLDARGERRRQAMIAASAAFYVALAAVCVVLSALGPPALEEPFLLSATVLGAIPVALRLGRAARRLRRPRVAPDPLFVGGYRTRPEGPLLPDRVLPRPAPTRAPERPRWRRPLVLALLSLVFVLGGLLMIFAPRRPADVFHGALSLCLFGLCTWVFVEQLVGGKEMLTGGAVYRTMVVLIGTCGAACTLAWTTTTVPLYERLLVGLGSGALAVFGVVRLWRVWRADRGRWRGRRG